MEETAQGFKGVKWWGWGLKGRQEALDGHHGRQGWDQGWKMCKPHHFSEQALATSVAQNGHNCPALACPAPAPPYIWSHMTQGHHGPKGDSGVQRPGSNPGLFSYWTSDPGQALAISQLQLSLLSNGYGFGSDLIRMMYIARKSGMHGAGVT